MIENHVNYLEEANKITDLENNPQQEFINYPIFILWREGILDSKLHWYPKFLNHALGTLGTFIDLDDNNQKDCINYPMYYGGRDTVNCTVTQSFFYHVLAQNLGYYY